MLVAPGRGGIGMLDPSVHPSLPRCSPASWVDHPVPPPHLLATEAGLTCRYRHKNRLGYCPDLDGGGQVWAAQQGPSDITHHTFAYLIILFLIFEHPCCSPCSSLSPPQSSPKETACPIYGFPMGPSSATSILKFAISDTIP